MDALATQILTLAACPPDRVIYLILYGSSVHVTDTPRDIDALLVCRDCHLAYVQCRIEDRMLNLHVVDEEIVDADLAEDRYGWIFLTKFLDYFRVLYGNQEAAARTKAKAYLRLLGQWARDNCISTIHDFSIVCDGIIATLRRWNPQFEGYVQQGRINLRNYKHYILKQLPQSEETQAVLEPLPHGFALRQTSPLLRQADLCVVLIRYWCLYVLYQVDPDLYLSERVDELLRKKGVIHETSQNYGLRDVSAGDERTSRTSTFRVRRN